MQAADLEQMIASCFRKPKEGEKSEPMTTSQIMDVMRKEYCNLSVTRSTMISLGLRLKEMGYDMQRTFKGRMYNVVQKKAA